MGKLHDEYDIANNLDGPDVRRPHDENADEEDSNVDTGESSADEEPNEDLPIELLLRNIIDEEEAAAAWEAASEQEAISLTRNAHKRSMNLHPS